MSQSITRRHFFGASATVTAGVYAATHASYPTASAQTAGNEAFKTKIFKAAICGDPTADLFEKLAAAGFNGVETTLWDTTPEKAAAARVIAEKFGMRIHSVMRGWAEFNNTDADARQKTIDATATSLRAAAAYGADTILLVPCRIGGMAMPDPWDFEMDFDPETLMVNKVVTGDNAPYKDYIEAQNRSTTMSIEAINGLIPLAAELGVVIAVENVWNNLWVKPEFLAAFVNSFDNIWVRTYFDIGNHTRYCKAEDWIMACGKTLIKLHCKDFKNDRSLRDGGTWKHLHEGSINWPAVRKCLEAVNYNGWMTDETGAPADAELARRMDAIIAGKQLTIE
ncbi:MAG: sugar phosphate isomerase/epimerase [Planctomycetaceae bacterium]|nr:sugar phosphate isomerase/epimerase [Planctomycetaceae bacterium]